MQNWITNTSNPDGTTSYVYDNGGQLIGADHSYQTDETYSFDANGNRTMSGYSTGTNNRLTSDGTYSYQYDAEANRTRRTHITTDATVDYTWDHRNRLTAVTFKTSAGVTTKKLEYTYDMYDRRISKRVDTNGDGTFDVAYRYVYDDRPGVDLNPVVFVFVDADGDGPGAATFSNRLLHGPAVDQIFADENSSGEVLWSLTDNQGTVRDVAKYNSSTDTTTVVNHLKYDSFGRITSQSDSAYQPLFAYTGREWDADAEMFYYRARWYDPVVGRFISEDPKGFVAGDTNVNRYVGNSPACKTDPSGKESREPSFWADYWRYLTNPSDMDTGLRYTFYGAVTVAGAAGAAAGGLAVAAAAGGTAAGGTATAVGTSTAVVMANGTAAGTSSIIVSAGGTTVGTSVTTIGATGTAVGSAIAIASPSAAIVSTADIYVIGSLTYTTAFSGVVGYNVLYTSSWTWAGANVPWLNGIISSGGSVLVYPGGYYTQMEIAHLSGAGYIQIGNVMVPGIFFGL